MFEFLYYLQSLSTAKYYTGRAGEHWVGPRSEAYGFTIHGAFGKRDSFNNNHGLCLRDWIVVRADTNEVVK